MCGIIGFGSKNKISNKIPWISSGLDTIKHRGPDNSGEWISLEKKVHFGHRRLSINDLSDLGSQPMYDVNHQICVIFNGEIYNFKKLREELILLGYLFKSKSDTEVIIFSYKEWGLDCVKKFEGMFVFALYDIEKKTSYCP